MANDKISYKVIANVGTLAHHATGWTKEVNVISWNSGAPKLDIRDWDPNHEHMSRGVTLNADEVQRLVEAVQARDAVGLLKDMAKAPRTSDYER